MEGTKSTYLRLIKDKDKAIEYANATMATSKKCVKEIGQIMEEIDSIQEDTLLHFQRCMTFH